MPHGTWTTTGGGGDSGSGVVIAAIIGAVFLFGGGAMAAVAAAVTELLITIAIIGGVLVVAVAGLLAWWVLKGRPAGEAKFEAARLERERARELEQVRQAALRHQRALELAAAGRTVIQNVIDPAGMLEMARMQQQPSWHAEPVRVLRGEVER